MLLGLYNTAVAVAANTSLGKAYGVKPELEAYLVISEKALATAKSKLTQVESLNAVPELKNTLSDLAKAAEAVLADIRDDENLDKIVNIVANHLGDFNSIAEFKEKLPKMASIKAMQQFGNKLIDLDNYERLGNMLSDFQDFSNLKKPDQIEALKELNDKTLLNKISSENAKLNIIQVKKDVKKMAMDVCKELKLTANESDSLVELFDTLTAKHLPRLNTLRQDLIKQLPAFLESENKRICKAHPELVVVQAKPSAVLAGFKKKVAKSATKRKVAESVGKVAPNKKKAL